MKKNARSPSFWAASGALVVFVAIAVWAIVGLTRYEQGRDLDNWQITLGVMADNRANAVSGWVEDQYRVLQELADNGSLQLYAQQIVQRPVENKPSEAAEISYLRNLIRATAERHGFVDKEPAGGRITANVAFQSDNSLTLFDSELRIITGTPGITESGTALQEALRAVLDSGKRALFDLHLNANGRPVVGFLVPVYGLQKQSGLPRPIGVLYGARDAGYSLFPLITVRNGVTKSDETLLVEASGDLIVYLSTLADNTLPMKKRLSANAKDLVAAYAVNHPGLFGRLRDYAGDETLFTSRQLAGLPWVLVQKIQVAEALEESRAHQNFLVVALLLSLLLVTALMVAAWWYGSSMRERAALADLRAKSRELEAQTNLLNAINDHMADCVFLVDQQACFVFANQALAGQVGMRVVDIRGKSVASVFGAQTAKLLQEACLAVLRNGRVLAEEMTLVLHDRAGSYFAAFVPVAYEDEGPDTVLVSLHDVTQLQEAQRRKELLMQQIVGALMRAIDLYDPYSANHSANTAAVALAIGRAMQLGRTSLATLEVAANLCNLGKLYIPRDILTKTARLTDDEQAIIRQEATYVREILSRIDFEGPVLEIVAQKHEYLDGSGYPLGLKGEAIILPARVLAVANAFVAMISPRAYRERLGAKEAMDQLLGGADLKYDRQVVAALFHVAENNIDWRAWDDRKQIVVLPAGEAEK